MYALIIEDELFRFDINRGYGFILKKDANLNEFIKVLYLSDVLDYYMKKYDNNVYLMEEYSMFLLRICQIYLKKL